MKHSLHTALMAIFILISSCTFRTQNEENSEESPSWDEVLKEARLKDISELTYLDIYLIAFDSENGSGMDFHGDDMGLSAIEDVSLEDGEVCATVDCGSKLVLKNQNDSSHVELAIKAIFDFPNNPVKEMVRYYTVEPLGSTTVGCQSLCLQGNTYPIYREIVSARYYEPTKTE